MISLFLFAWFAGQGATSGAAQHIQAGFIARNQHQIDVEITEFRMATELDPKLADAFFNLGAAYMEKRDYAAAIPPLKRTLDLSPDLPAAHQLLGYALLAEGYAAEAIPQRKLSRRGQAGFRLLIQSSRRSRLIQGHPKSETCLVG